MAREKMTKTKLDSIYWYKVDGKKKFAYRYKYYDEYGKRREKAKQGFDSIDAAERALIEVKANVLDGNLSFIQNDTLTTEQLNKLYSEAFRGKWKPTTERNHQYIMEKYVLPHIGHFKIKNVNNMVIQRELFDELSNQDFKEGTLISIYRRVHAIFNFAIQNELLDRKRFTTPKFKNVAESTKREAIALSDVEKILEIARTKYKITHYTALSTLFLTGMRVGELRALRWDDDIDFENNVIYINKTKDRYGSRSPKTKNSYRKFPMNENIRNLLLNYKEWYDEKMKSFAFRNPEGHVFVTYAGEPLGERYLKRIIDLICEKENIPHFTPHYLRHTFVSIQLSKNIPITTVAALVGDTPDTIYKTYAHSFKTDEIYASNIMDDIITLNAFSDSEEIKN